MAISKHLTFFALFGLAACTQLEQRPIEVIWRSSHTFKGDQLVLHLTAENKSSRPVCMLNPSIYPSSPLGRYATGFNSVGSDVGFPAGLPTRRLYAVRIEPRAERHFTRPFKILSEIPHIPLMGGALDEERQMNEDLRAELRRGEYDIELQVRDLMPCPDPTPNDPALELGYQTLPNYKPLKIYTTVVVERIKVPARLRP